MKAKPILIRRIRKMAPILLQQNILRKVIEILILPTPIANPSIAALNVCRSNYSTGITHNQFLMVPPPDIPIQVPLN